MDYAELVLGIALALVFAGIAVYYGMRQRQTLRQVRSEPDLPPEDRRYLHQQAVRRLACSVLMLILSGVIIGGLFLQPNFDEIRPLEPDGKLTPEARETLGFFTFYWIFALLLFLGVMALAVLDIMATARYARRQHKQIELHHREALEAEAARLRRRHELN